MYIYIYNLFIRFSGAGWGIGGGAGAGGRGGRADGNGFILGKVKLATGTIRSLSLAEKRKRSIHIKGILFYRRKTDLDKTVASLFVLLAAMGS